MQWLGRDTSGVLVYDQQPYVYYDVRPVKRIEIKQYEYRENGETFYSGTFTAVFRCYDPFGKLSISSYVDTCAPQLMDATGILRADMMPPVPVTTDVGFMLYNCGTEKAPLIIRLAGDVGDGLSIENETTGQVCKIIGLKADEIPAGAYLEINSETGQVWLVKGPDRELAFHYHDMGYLHAAPCTPFERSLMVTHTTGDRQITTDGGFTPEMVGQYIHLSGSWMEIRQVNDNHTAQLRNTATETGWTETPVATMNKLWLRGDGVNLSRFEVEYIPRVK